MTESGTFISNVPGLKIEAQNEFPFDISLDYYLAGPMSGYEGYNYHTFERVAFILRDNDVKIKSPHEIDHGETPETRGSKSYQDYIDAGFEMLDSCQGIILLPGWPQSTGAMLELNRARDKFMPVYFYQESSYSQYVVHLICMNRTPK